MSPTGTSRFQLVMHCIRTLLLAILVSPPAVGQTVKPPVVGNTASFRFLVAGHAYGSHEGDNVALHPPLVAALHSGAFGKIDFIVFTGDVLRRFTRGSFDLLEEQLKPVGVEYYVASGNHDASKFGRSALLEKFGALYHQFDVGTSRFIILDTQEVSRTVSPDQLAFLREALEKSPQISAFFVFMHELIWLSEKPEYRKIRANGRSRQSKLKASNYWKDVHPLFVKQSPTPVFVIAGDVAGNADAIPAFHDRVDNVTLIASGMGEVKEENALLVAVTGGTPSFELHPMDAEDSKRALDFYSPTKLNELPSDAFTRTAAGIPSYVFWIGIPVLLLIILAGLTTRRRRLRT